MRDSVPSPRYSPVCNVLRQWKTSLIPTMILYLLSVMREYVSPYIIQPTGWFPSVPDRCSVPFSPPYQLLVPASVRLS